MLLPLLACVRFGVGGERARVIITEPGVKTHVRGKRVGGKESGDVNREDSDLSTKVI